MNSGSSERKIHVKVVCISYILKFQFYFRSVVLCLIIDSESKVCGSFIVL